MTVDSNGTVRTLVTMDGASFVTGPSWTTGLASGLNYSTIAQGLSGTDMLHGYAWAWAYQQVLPPPHSHPPTPTTSSAPLHSR
jgi:hypothetical protein